MAMWTKPRAERIAPADVGEWIHQLGLARAVPTIPGPYEPDVSGAYVQPTLTTGTGDALEGVLHCPGLQIRVVGPPGDYDLLRGHDEARTTADAIDDALNDPRNFPAQVGARTVLWVIRVGGMPFPDRIDDADRQHYVAQYVLNVDNPNA